MSYTLFIVMSSLTASLATHFVQKTKLQASDIVANDNFGCSVSISNSYLVAGAIYQDVNGVNSGAAYVFKEQNNGSWIQIQKLQASDGEASDFFGRSVSISNNYLVIGAYGEDTGDVGTGAAYIFERDNNDTWNQVQKLQAALKHSYDCFGWDVSISNDYLVIGAYKEDTGGSSAGAAFIFERNNFGLWQQVQKLQASDKEASDYFGISVSISNIYVAVGAYGEDTGATNAGAVYIFERGDTGQWTQIQKLQASDKEAGDYFGRSVSISNNYLVVGAYAEDTGGTSAGAAYIFERDQSTSVWNQVQKLQASDQEAYDYFGWSVSISNDYVVVGAYGEDTGGVSAGAAFIFERNNFGFWQQVQKTLQASDAGTSDHFGESVSMSDGKVVIGSYLEDTGGTNAGSIYVFNQLITEEHFTSEREIGIVRFKQDYEYMCHVFGEGLFMKHGPGIILDSIFIKVTALNSDPDCYSFKSIHYPNYYIIHRLDDGNNIVDLWQIESESFKNSGTWCDVSALNGDDNSFTWYPYDYTDYYMKVDENQSNKIIVAQNDNTIKFANDASWIVEFN